MIFISYTKTDTYYEFVGENGNKQIYPVGSIILTDDESGMIAIKITASRQTIGLVVKPEPPFSGKFKLTLNDSSTVTAECTSTAETITKSEISAYTSSVESVVIGDCVTEIGANAFRQCTGLTSMTIPASVTSVGYEAFYNVPWWAEYSADTTNQYGNIVYINDIAYKAANTGITSCEFKSSTASIGDSAFMRCSSLTSVNIPTGVTTIEDDVFNSCGSLSSVTIPSSVTSINYRAFFQCSGLTSVEIPSGVTNIGDSAFYKCTGLESITVNATTPPTLVPYKGRYENFLHTNDCPIYVPAASVDTYKAAEGWSDYADRITAIV